MLSSDRAQEEQTRSVTLTGSWCVTAPAWSSGDWAEGLWASTRVGALRGSTEHGTAGTDAWTPARCGERAWQHDALDIQTPGNVSDPAAPSLPTQIKALS